MRYVKDLFHKGPFIMMGLTAGVVFRWQEVELSRTSQLLQYELLLFLLPCETRPPPVVMMTSNVPDLVSDLMVFNCGRGDHVHEHRPQSHLRGVEGRIALIETLLYIELINTEDNY